MLSRESAGKALGTFTPLAIAILLPLAPVIAEAGVLAVIPLLAIVLPLLCGHFPGEAVLDRLAARARPARARRRRFVASTPRRRPVAGLLRSRLLIAASLAERAPPAVRTA